MTGFRAHLDPWSKVIILATLALFVVALFTKGLSHDLLLEAGVFLVSAKLILMAYKNSIASAALHDRFDELQSSISRIERRLESPANRGESAGNR